MVSDLDVGVPALVWNASTYCCPGHANEKVILACGTGRKNTGAIISEHQASHRRDGRLAAA
jgi:hypothetical protein